jgi:hypothetical protein
MKIAWLAIQCKTPEGEVGDFLYEPDSFVPVSPVFECLVALFAWCRENGWKSVGYDEVLRERGPCGTYVKRSATSSVGQ